VACGALLEFKGTTTASCFLAKIQLRIAVHRGELLCQGRTLVLIQSVRDHYALLVFGMWLENNHASAIRFLTNYRGQFVQQQLS